MVVRQKCFLALVLVVNSALWFVSSDVYRLVVMGDPVLRGRYSREHFSWNVGVAVLSAVFLYVDQARSRATYRRRAMIAVSGSLSAALTLALLDWALRVAPEPLCVVDGELYHRLPHRSYRASFADRPPAARSYPVAGAGHPTRETTLTTDARGFRNAEALSSAEVVVLGDSFAEGTGVSDAECWPVRLARRSGRSVYNLGMSGYTPQH